jgi:hypothetical protein
MRTVTRASKTAVQNGAVRLTKKRQRPRSRKFQRRTGSKLSEHRDVSAVPWLGSGLSLQRLVALILCNAYRADKPK